MKLFKIRSVKTTITVEVYESEVKAESKEQALELFQSGDMERGDVHFKGDECVDTSEKEIEVVVSCEEEEVKANEHDGHHYRIESHPVELKFRAIVDDGKWRSRWVNTMTEAEIAAQNYIVDKLGGN